MAKRNKPGKNGKPPAEGSNRIKEDPPESPPSETPTVVELEGNDRLQMENLLLAANFITMRQENLKLQLAALKREQSDLLHQQKDLAAELVENANRRGKFVQDKGFPKGTAVLYDNGKLTVVAPGG